MAGGRGASAGSSLDRRRYGKRAAGVVIGLVAVVLLIAVALVWADGVARREAVENALQDVPGLQADPSAVRATAVAPPADAQAVQVVRVVDGDTLVVTAQPGPVVEAGGEATIRLLEIDAPEVDGPQTTEQCFGPEAGAYSTELLPVGTTLLLSRDEELLDRFDRILAYAWTEDGTFVNESILRNGYGYATFVPPNDEHISIMLAAEDAARADRRGVWGTCA